MAKEKSLKISTDRELGTVTKRLSSGMFLTSKGDKVPPFPGVGIGIKIKLVQQRFEIVGEKEKEVVAPADADKAEITAMRKEIEELKKLVGDKGSAVKTTVVAKENTTAPKQETTPQKVG